MKYKIIKEGLRLEGAEVGDIVDMNDGASTIALEAGVVELCEDQEIPSKHVLILADPAMITNQTLNPQ